MSEPSRPVLRIVSGNPTPEELAAVVVAVLNSAPAEPEPAPVRRVGGWADPAARLRQPLQHGPGAWR